MTRAELYQKFGPLLLDAICQIIRDELNILRNKAGLPERTNEQVLNAFSDKLNSLEPYNWMENSGI